MSERLSFEAAARELGISESELESLVAEGQIAASKDGDQLLFTRAAIDTYKSQADEPAILLSDDDLGMLEGADEIDFGIDIEEPVAAASGSETDVLSLDDDGIDLDSGGLELDLDSDEISAVSDPEATVVDLGGGFLDDDGTDSLLEGGDLGDDTLLDTDVLDLGDDDTETFDLDTAEETLFDVDEGAGALLRGGGARVMQMKKKKGQPAFTALLAVSGLVLLLPLAVLLALVYSETLSPDAADNARGFYRWIVDYNFIGPVAEALAKLFG